MSRECKRARTSGKSAAAGHFTRRSRQSTNSGSKCASFSSFPMGKRRARLRSCCRSYCKPLPCPCFLLGLRRRSWTFPSPPYRILLSILLFMKTRFPSSCTHRFPVLYPLHDCTTECRHKRNARGNATKLFRIIQKKCICQEKLTRKARYSSLFLTAGTALKNAYIRHSRFKAAAPVPASSRGESRL
jgi:hypothetical protein